MDLIANLATGFGVAFTPINLLYAFIGCVLGTLIGIGRLSRNLLVRSLCGTYVEATRNVPLLLQLFLIFFGAPVLGFDINPWVAAGVALVAAQAGARFHTAHVQRVALTAAAGFFIASALFLLWLLVFRGT